MESLLALLDSLFDYVSARLRLEGHRLEARGRALAARAIVIVIALAVALYGLSFLSHGAAILISERLGSRAAGPLIVGGTFVAAALVSLVMAMRRSG